MNDKLIINIEETYYNKTPKKNLNKLNFLKKYIHPNSELFIDNRTGIIRSELKKTPEEILQYWSKIIFTSKDKEYSNQNGYTAAFPYAKARLNYVYETINNFLKNNKKNVICDYACGEGILLDIFKKKGYRNIIGVEHSKVLVKNIKKKLKIKCYSSGLGFGNLKNFQHLEEARMSILTWVLCNCVNPLKVLREISSRIKVNNYICIAESSRILVPFKKKLNDYLNKKHISDTHPWHFTKNSLSNLLYLSNFEVVYTNYYKDSDILLLIGKKTKKINKKKIKTDDPKKIKNFLLEWDKYSSKKNIFE
jgi:hypothetical protein